MMKFLPFIIFAAIAGFLYKGLSLNPSEVPSPFIGKPAPQVRGALLNGGKVNGGKVNAETINAETINAEKVNAGTESDSESMTDPASMFDSASMKGQVWILNVWASWCRECAYEHPLFVDLAKTKQVPIVGLNYKDQTADANQWLARFSDPYSHIIEDQAGNIGLDWGVYAVPETFVIDKQGIVRHKVIGPVTPDMLSKKIIPLLEKLMAKPS